MLTAERADAMTFSELVFSDLQRYRAGERGWLRVLARCVVIPGLIASIILRAQQCLYRSGHATLANVLRTVGNVAIGVDFAPGMQVGPGLLLIHPVGLTFGFGVTIGSNVSMGGGVTMAARYPDTREQELATVCDDAVIGAHAVLVGGVRVGHNALIGPNSVVLSDVEDNAVVLGNPARRVGTRDDPVTS